MKITSSLFSSSESNFGALPETDGIWNRLSQTYPATQGFENRQYVRLLSSILLSTGLIVTVAIIWKQFANIPILNETVSSVVLMVTVLAYILSRSKYYKIAFILTILMIWGSSLSGSILENEPQILYFIIFSPLVGSLFLSPLGTILVAACSSGVILALPMVNSIFNFENIINPAFIVALTGVLATVAASVQLRDFQRIEQQSHKLSAYVNELIQGREALQQSEARLQLQITRMPIACIMWDTQFRVTSWNPAAEKIFGFSEEEALGKHPYDLIVPEETREHVNDIWARLLKGDTTAHSVNENLTKGGSTIQCEWSNTPLNDTDGKIIGVLSMVQDLTDRFRTQEALSASEERYRNLFDRIPLALYRTTPQGQILETNLALVELLGYPDRETLQATNVTELYVESEDRIQENLKLEREGIVQDVQFQLRRYDGRPIWVRDTSRIVKNAASDVSFYEGSLEDITERKRGEQVQLATYKISQAAVSTRSLDELYVSIHKILGSLMPVENFYIALYEPANDLLCFPYYVDQYDPQPGPQKAAHGLTEYVIRTGNSLLASPEVFEHLIQQGEVDLVGTGSVDWVGVPLKTEERVIGVMVAQSYTEGIRYTREDEDLLKFVSTQVALAIKRKQTEEQLHRNAIRAEMLAETSQLLVEIGLDYQAILDIVTQRVATLIGDACGILLLSEDRNQIQFASLYHPQSEMLDVIRKLVTSTNPRVGEGMIGEVLKTGRPAQIDAVPLEKISSNLPPEYQSRLKHYRIQGFMIVPMRAQGRVIGALGITRSQPGRSYDSDDQIFLQEIADRAAMAIVNAQLYKKVQRSLSKVQALRQIDIAITGSVDLRISVGAILDQVISQMGVDAANVLVFNTRTLTLDYISGKGFHTNALQHTHLPLGVGYAGQAALERKIIEIQNLAGRQTDFLRSLFFAEEGFISYFAVPLIAKGLVKGVLEIFHRSLLEPDPEWMDFLEALAGQAAIAIDNTTLFDELQHSNQELTLAYDATIEGWSHALDLRDNETEGHTKRVAELTLRLAREMEISDSEIVHVRRGALLHDIGKMGIPDKILHKPGPLTNEEWVMMKKHPEFAYEMLSPITYLKPALEIPYCHHEKWDGTGYPRGLKGEQIPLVARIFAVVDVWDALCSDRPYRPAWKEEEALEYIRSKAGEHFDPSVVEIFLKVLP